VKLRFVVFLTLLLLFSTPSRAELEFSATDLLTGLEQYQEGAFEDAARSWSEQAHRLSDGLAERDSLARSAFISVLASMAWEQAGSARAYTQWARSIETMLRANTNWDEMREKLSEVLNESRSELSTVDPETGVVGVGPDLVALIAVDEALNFREFDGPDAGLSNQIDTGEEITVSKSYFARPLSLVEQDISESDDDRQRRSGLDDEPPEESGQLIGRGMDAEASDAQVGSEQDTQTDTTVAAPPFENSTGVSTVDTARSVTPVGRGEEDEDPVEQPVAGGTVEDGPVADEPVDGDSIADDSDPATTPGLADPAIELSEDSLTTIDSDTENLAVTDENAADAPDAEIDTETEISDVSVTPESDTSNSSDITTMPVSQSGVAELVDSEALTDEPLPDIESTTLDATTTVMGIAIRPSGDPDLGEADESDARSDGILVAPLTIIEDDASSIIDEQPEPIAFG